MHVPKEKQRDLPKFAPGALFYSSKNVALITGSIVGIAVLVPWITAYSSAKHFERGIVSLQYENTFGVKPLEHLTVKDMENELNIYRTALNLS